MGRGPSGWAQAVGDPTSHRISKLGRERHQEEPHAHPRLRPPCQGHCHPQIPAHRWQSHLGGPKDEPDPETWDNSSSQNRRGHIPPCSCPSTPSSAPIAPPGMLVKLCPQMSPSVPKAPGRQTHQLEDVLVLGHDGEFQHIVTAGQGTEGSSWTGSVPTCPQAGSPTR